jgi:hypothetical protein
MEGSARRFLEITKGEPHVFCTPSPILLPDDPFPEVVTPPAGRERISAAYFLGARLDATVPLLSLPPSLASEARGPERDPGNPLFREVGQNYLKGRLRSHPDVAQRYYADLVPPGPPAQSSSGY